MLGRFILSKKNVEYKSSSVQVELEDSDSEIVAAFHKTQDSIDDSLLYFEKGPGEEGEEYGKEDEPHITVLYGLSDPKETDEIVAFLQTQAPIEGVFGQVSLFEGNRKGKEKPYDVVKVDIESEGLHALHEAIAEAGFELKGVTFPEYVPHCTLAYVKVGSLDPGSVDNALEGQTFVVDIVHLSVGGNKGNIAVKLQNRETLLSSIDGGYPIFSKESDPPAPTPEVTPDDFLPYFSDPETQEPSETPDEPEELLSGLTSGLVVSKKKREPNKTPTRALGEKIQEEGEAKYGKNQSPTDKKSYDQVVNGIVEDVSTVLGSKNMEGAEGWYTKHWNTALEVISDEFPELLNDEASRVLFTAIVGVTSQGNNVSANLYMSLLVYDRFRKTGVISPEGVWGDKAPSIKQNIGIISTLVSKLGVEDAMKYLYQKGDPADLAKRALSDGLIRKAPKNFPSKVSDSKQQEEYLKSIEVPMSGVIFGPKVGLFFANLLGMTDYVTIDLWMSRSIGRYRQTLLPEVRGTGMSRKDIEKFQTEEAKKKALQDEKVAAGKAKNPYSMKSLQGLAAYKVLKGHPEWKDQTAWVYVFDDAQEQKAYYKKYLTNDNLPEDLKLATILYKKFYVKLHEVPRGKFDRVMTIRAVQEATRHLNEKFGTQITPSDVQALLWYFEKDYYAELRGENVTLRTNFGEVSHKVLDDFRKGNAAAYQAQPGEPEGDEEADEAPEELLNEETGELVQ